MKKPYVKPMIRSRPIQPGDIEAGARFAQKRSVPRYPFAARAVILEPLSRREFAGRTSDISLKGCFIESVDQFPTKTIVQIKLELTGESFTPSAVIFMFTVYLRGDGSAKNCPTSGWNLSPISSIPECFNFGLGPRCHFPYFSSPSISELV